MNKKLLIAIIVAVGLLAAVYFYVYPKLTHAPKPDEFKNVVITLERTPCFGFCPAYKLTIYGDGRVAYDGKSYVKVKGMQNSQISQDKVQELVNEFYKIGYFSLEDRYEAPVSDLPTQTTSFTIDGHTKTVVDYYAAPKKLSDLENKIDEIANSTVWIGKCRPQSEGVVCE